MQEEFIECLENLSDDKTFHLKIRSYELANALVKSISQPQPEAKSLLKEVKKNISNLAQQSVYTVLKYLIFMHEVLHVCRTELECSKVRQLFSLIQLQKMKDRFDEYFRVKLLIPYLQYLTKYSQILQLKFSSLDIASSTQDIMFLEFNLLLFTAATFATPLKQFTSFLNKFYPFLQKYPILMARDVFFMLDNVKAAHPQETIKSISFLEVEQLGSNLCSLLPKQKKTFEDTRDSSGETRGRYSPIPTREITAFQNLQGTLTPFL